MARGWQKMKKAVNNIVLSLAKTVFGFINSRDAKDKDAARETNRQAKEQALGFIKSNEAIKAGLIKNAANDED